MGQVIQSLIWGGTIILAAVVTTSIGMSDDVSFVVVLGLSAAAWASLYRGDNCVKECL